MSNLTKNNRGFTLLEMMLVIVIMISIVVMSIRYIQVKTTQTLINRTSLQAQQILSAATSYYVNNHTDLQTGSSTNPGSGYTNEWPTTFGDLVNYLPTRLIGKAQKAPGPYGPGTYTIATTDGTAKRFELDITTKTVVEAQQLLSKLPLASIRKSNLKLVKVYINIPSYDYNHARTVSDVGIYHPGDLITVKNQCPAGLTQSVYAVPESAYGFSNGKLDTNAYPISGLMAYVKGDGKTEAPAKCYLNEAVKNHFNPGVQKEGQAGQYRVCESVNTPNGPAIFTNSNSVSLTNNIKYFSIMVITKCSYKNNTQTTQDNAKGKY
jgi:type II secretory pathway pseudopilin PulG